MKAPQSPDPVPPYLLLVMTASTGVVDAVSLLALGHVFTANMTGNVVFLGFALAGASGFSIARSSVALIFFLLGALMGGRLSTGMNSRPLQYWTARAFGLDGLVLIIAALAYFMLVNPASEGSTPLFAVIGLTALAMGLRNATARKLGVPDLTTTVLTMTITGLAADSSLAGGTNPRWQRRVASVLLMFAGAFAGGLMVKSSVVYPLLLCGIGSIASAFLMSRSAPLREDSRSASSAP
jgi:uncharacterized membrane protein YoaK (UPF0700 family)